MSESAQQFDDLTFSDLATRQCPFSAYAHLRENAPVYKDPVLGHYIVTRYADIRRAALDYESLSNITGLIVTKEGPAKEEIDRIYAEKGWLPMDTLVSNDPPSHRMYRALVDTAFTKKYVSGLRARIESVARELIEELAGERGPIEIVSRFAIPFPVRIITEQVGVDPKDSDRIRHWADCINETTDPDVSPQRDIELAHILTEMQQCFAENIRRVQAAPDGTLLSRLIQATVEDRHLDMREMQSFLHMFLSAGHDTTTTALSSAIRFLAEQPGLIETLHREPGLFPTFVEESLRLASPVQTIFRKALKDITIVDVRIPKGSIVELRYGAGNRDESVFADAATMDLHRRNAANNLTFGYGIHTCIGNQLARAEVEVAAREFVAKFSRIRPVEPERAQGSKNYLAYGLKSYCVEFEPR